MSHPTSVSILTLGSVFALIGSSALFAAGGQKAYSNPTGDPAEDTYLEPLHQRRGRRPHAGVLRRRREAGCDAGGRRRGGGYLRGSSIVRAWTWPQRSAGQGLSPSIGACPCLWRASDHPCRTPPRPGNCWSFRNPPERVDADDCSRHAHRRIVVCGACGRLWHSTCCLLASGSQNCLRLFCVES